MKNLTENVCLFSVVVLLLASCSNQQMYDSIQKNNEIRCFELPVPQQEECLEKVRSVGYEEYELERKKASDDY